MVRLPGGGGWGDPLQRNREDVLRDLRDELISREAAVADYGLTAAEADEVVARHSWERVRANVRAARGERIA